MSSIDSVSGRGISNELKSLLEIDEKKLIELANELEDAAVSTNVFDEITRLIDKAIGGGSPSIILEKHIMAMATFRRRRRSSAVDVVNSVFQSNKGINWDSEDVGKWEKLAPTLCRLIDSKIIVTAEKSASLYYDHEKLWMSSSLVTDMRPVFDDKRTQIVAGVITHTLKIMFRDDSGSPSEFAIALDLEDIDSLISICEEARMKDNLASQKFQEGIEVPVIKFGDLL